MARGMVLFAIVVVAATWLLGAAMLATKDSLDKLAGLVLVPALFIPLIMAYVAHRFSGATGNPFKGLTWGHTSWYFLSWIIGLVVAALALIVAVGLGLNRFDPSMSSYIELMASQAPQGGGASPQGAETGIRIVGYFTAFGAPTIFPWIGTFPWYGWFFRRAMVGGRANAIMIVMGLSLITGIVGGLADNPMWNDLPMWMRLTMTAVSSLAFVPAVSWIFLRTRSAVIPALAMATFQDGLLAASPFLSIETPMFAAPNGLIGSLVALAAGIGLWVWKDPGGKELAVAAVAHDGTPLTPEQVRRLDEQVGGVGSAPVVREGLAPPPPTPGVVEGLPPGDDRPDRSNIESGGADGQ
jgi:hypothetical protein